MPKKLLLQIILLLSPALLAFGQNTVPDNNYDSSFSKAVALYNQFTDGNARIYNGREYLPYIFHSETNPFFNNPAFKTGTVYYEGRAYRNIALQYDISRDEIVIIGPHEFSHIVLQNDKVDSFKFQHHTFIKIIQDAALYKNLESGFYDVVYDGHLRILVRRRKDLQSNPGEKEITYTFYNKNHFFLLKDGHYNNIKSRKDLLKVFTDRKHSIKKYWRKNKIKYHKDPENAIVKATIYYDHLSH